MKANIKMVSIKDIKENPNNPRKLNKDKYQKLLKSIQDLPQMLGYRPIVVNSDMVVLGGNMRLKALKELKYKEVPIIIADELTEDQQKEFLIKDNLGYGEWDWDMIANEWDMPLLKDWGMDLPNDFVSQEEYEDIEPSGYDLTQKWFLNIEFENEQDCEKWYNSLIEEGLICKIVQ